MKNSDEVRVVVVDDSADAAEALAAGLRADGYNVRLAHDGREALAVIEEHAPHCVLLDVDMPNMDGAELARHLRERHRDDIVLVAVTGWDEDDARVAGAYACVDHYLRKPVDPAVLRRLLDPQR